MESNAKRVCHFQHCGGTGVAFARECLVEAFSAQSRVACQVAHAASPRYVAPRLGNEGGIITRFIEAGIKIRGDLFFGVQVLRRIPCKTPSDYPLRPALLTTFGITNCELRHEG